jgi:hypothetical protein
VHARQTGTVADDKKQLIEITNIAARQGPMEPGIVMKLDPRLKTIPAAIQKRGLRVA